MNFKRRLIWEIEGLKFLLRNINGAKLLITFDSKFKDGYVYSGILSRDICKFNRIHKELRDSSGLNFWRYLLYFFFGKKFAALVKDESGEVIAFQMFYFKADEINRKILHEAFIGVRNEYRGNSLATKLRLFSKSQFQKSSISKISSNIPKDNSPSLRSALKSGFYVSEVESTHNAYYLFNDL